MVSAQPSHAPEMLTIGFAANRFNSSVARLSHLESPRSNASNSSSTRTPDSLSIGLEKAQRRREFVELYNPVLQKNLNFFCTPRNQQTGLVYNDML